MADDPYLERGDNSVRGLASLRSAAERGDETLPELPEVETVMRGLVPRLEGRVLTRVVQRRPDLRFPRPENFVQRLEGRRVVRLGRRAKYILMELSGGETLICHLGMSGRFLLLEPPAPPPLPHDHVDFETAEGGTIRFNDPRRFGFMLLTETAKLAQHPMLRDLGPEPLDPGFDGPTLLARLAGRRSPLKAALLDQSVVAGVGNIYASEALYEAGLSPRRLASSLGPARAHRLAVAVREVLTRAVAAGGSSLRDYVQVSGELGYFQHAWRVYDRAGEACDDCPGSAPATGRRCAGIQRIVQSNRATY